MMALASRICSLRLFLVPMARPSASNALRREGISKSMSGVIEISLELGAARAVSLVMATAISGAARAISLVGDSHFGRIAGRKSGFERVVAARNDVDQGFGMEKWVKSPFLVCSSFLIWDEKAR